jgi:hypothetical protein
MFPAGAPGIALLMLRISVAAMLLIAANPAANHGNYVPSVTWQFLVLVALCILLCLGLFTPAASVLSAVLIGVLIPFAADRETINVLLTLVITICLGLLGPGAFSIDARLFGRRIVPALPAED